MAEFKVGGSVICIDASSKTNLKVKNAIPLTKNKVYKVYSISRSPCCGALVLHVGFDSMEGKSLCTSCNRGTFRNDLIWWFRADRFLPLDDFREVTFEKIIKEVPVGAQ